MPFFLVYLSQFITWNLHIHFSITCTCTNPIPLPSSNPHKSWDLQEWIMEVGTPGEDGLFQSLAYCITSAVDTH